MFRKGGKSVATEIGNRKRVHTTWAGVMLYVVTRICLEYLRGTGRLVLSVIWPRRLLC
jgi:hypothetical protein